MNRRSYSNSPPISRTIRRSSLNSYDGSSNERRSPEPIRRRPRSSPSPRPSRYLERDKFSRSKDLDRSRSSYKVLAVSALHPKASDEQVKETLYREYRKFGKISIRISHEIGDKVAYVYFRSSKDARDAKRSKPRISLYDKIALVTPVYSRDHYESRASHSRSRSFSPDYDRYHHRSPISPESFRPNPSDRFHEHLPYDTLPPMLPLRDFREIGLPLFHPHALIPRRPMLHHVAPIHPHLEPIHSLYGPPRHLIPPFRPHAPHFMHEKKEKFPNFMHHIPPEDDPLATRTLFAGNLEIDISDESLKRIFGRYGVVEDIDVKRPLRGTGNAYAFVRYQNLDMAHRAKVELSGQYLGKFQCKIGYGKSRPTQRIWIGGLGPWTSHAQLEREFDRFGVIEKIEYVTDDSCAYIQFESIDAATAAVKKMRGVALGNPEHKLRTDFADEGVCGSPTSKFKLSQNDIAAAAGDLRDENGWSDDSENPYSSKNYPKVHSKYGEKNIDFGNRDNDRSFKQHSVSDIGSPRSPKRSPFHQSIDSEVESEEGVVQSSGPLTLASVRTLSDLALKCTDKWQGSLVLKSSQFPAKCHLTSGNPNLIALTMKDENGKSILRITQRLRLDKPKLEDVSKRIKTANIHAIFLAMPCLTNSIALDDALTQIRPLHNLILYLKQKEAAGVISLVGKIPEPTGVIYVFPPCEYSANLLKQSAKNLSNETLEDDHLVIVVVIGGIS